MLSVLFPVLLLALSYGISSLSHSSSAKTIEWSNWDRLEKCSPARFVQPASEEAIAKAIAGAPSVRVAGAGHSFSPIVLTNSDGVILQLDAMNKPISIRPLENELDGGKWAPGNESSPASGPAAVQIQAGMRVHELNTFLTSKGLALENSGAIAIQSVAGATSTSTHGTGKSLGSMATSLLGLTIVLANGTVIETNATVRPDIYQVARVGLGALGVISRVTVRAIPLYKLRRVATPYSLKEFLPWVYPSAYNKFERMQWYFTPLTDSATLLLREPVPFSEPIVDCWNTSLWQSVWVDPATEDLSVHMPATTERVAADALMLTPEGFSQATSDRSSQATSDRSSQATSDRSSQATSDRSSQATSEDQATNINSEKQKNKHNSHHGNDYSTITVPKPSGPSVICTDLAYRTLAHETDDYDLYEEMEIFVPLNSSQALIEGLIAFQNSTVPPPQDPSWAQYSLFTGMRYVAADDIPLSMMHGRDTGVVSFITLGNHSITGPPTVFEHYAKQLEQDGRDLTGRFHWGKMNWATVKDVRVGWGDVALEAFLAVQQELDPKGIFLNEYLKERLL